MPKPRMNRNTSGSQNASCTCRVDMRKKPTAAMALEATSIHLYFPVRAAMKPLAVDVMKMPMLMGTHMRPASSGLISSTIWK